MGAFFGKFGTNWSNYSKPLTFRLEVSAGDSYIKEGKLLKLIKLHKGIMMASMNRVTLVGNLGQAPEMRYTQNQIPVCNFSLATTETRTDAQGQKQEQTEWHRVIVWNKQAENVNKYLTKGSSVLVEGKITYRKWQDKNGQDRYTTDIVAQRVLFLSRSQQDQNQGYAQQYGTPAQPPMTSDPFASQPPAPQADPFTPAAPQQVPATNFPPAEKKEEENSMPAGTPSLDDIPF